MFERYVLAQEKKVGVALKAVELRDQHQSFNEWEQRLKKMKYEDRILRMNIAEEYPEDQAWYRPIQQEIRNHYCKKMSSFDFETSLDWNLYCSFN